MLATYLYTSIVSNMTVYNILVHSIPFSKGAIIIINKIFI